MPNATKRDKWDRPIESIFAQIGYCVGLGNLWRFPYLCQKNGGGVFLIPYALSLVVMSIPLYIFEVGLGQVTSRGRVAAWDRLPLMKGIGYASMVLDLFAMLPYMMVMAWGLLYLGHSLTTGPLPWTTCDNPWNTQSCVSLHTLANHSSTQFPLANISSKLNYSAVYDKESLAQVQFWSDSMQLKLRSIPAAFDGPAENYVLRIPNPGSSIDGEFNWPILCSLIAAFVTVFFVTVGGIKTSGKVVYFTATFPYVILIALLVRGASLEGASKGLQAYLIPDLPQLAQAQVWIDAISQAIYTFGIGFAALTVFGGYNKFNNNFYRSSFVVVCLGSLTSFTMGLATFSVLGHMSHVMGKNVSEVMQSGPGLVFQVFPVGIGLMPAPQLWSVMFFLMIYFVAIDTSFSEFEAIMAVIGDAFPKFISTRRMRACTNTALGVAFFIMCLPQVPAHGIYVFELMNVYGACGISMVLLALCEAVTAGWLWDVEQFGRDVKDMTGSNLAGFIKLCYKFFTPLVALFVLLFFIIKWEPLTVGDFVYPPWGNAIGWLMALASILCIPGFASYVMWQGKGTLRERFQQGLRSRIEEEEKDEEIVDAATKMMEDNTVV